MENDETKIGAEGEDAKTEDATVTTPADTDAEDTTVDAEEGDEGDVNDFIGDDDTEDADV